MIFVIIKIIPYGYRDINVFHIAQPYYFRLDEIQI